VLVDRNFSGTLVKDRHPDSSIDNKQVAFDYHKYNDKVTDPVALLRDYFSLAR
jgi:hypothetical protein